MAKEVKVCKECGVVQIFESAYDKMSELERAEFAALLKATEFLENIANGYDQDSAPLRGTSAEKLQSPDVREKIPVFSDVNIVALQKLLVDFFTRNIKLDFKPEPAKES